MTLSDQPIHRAAKTLFRENRDGATYTGLADDVRPGDLAAGYDIQTELCRLLSDDGEGPVVGYKVALTSATMQEMVGFDQPCIGTLLARRMTESPTRVRAAAYGRLGVECEVAVRIGDPPSSGIHTAATIARHVDACHVAFELVDDRNATYDDLHGPTLIADNCWNAGVVLGDGTREWHSLDLVDATAVLAVNGVEAATGRAGDAMGHPFEVLAWMTNTLAERGISLGSHMWVITGSVVQTQFPTPGDQLDFTLDGLGSVSLTVE